MKPLTVPWARDPRHHGAVAGRRGNSLGRRGADARDVVVHDCPAGVPGPIHDTGGRSAGAE